jgi:DNA-directed RNA polymerase subunit RPC12/RpoP
MFFVVDIFTIYGKLVETIEEEIMGVPTDPMEVTNKLCRRCGTKVLKETDPDLAKDYQYYCPECNENMFTFEVEDE